MSRAEQLNKLFTGDDPKSSPVIINTQISTSNSSTETLKPEDHPEKPQEQESIQQKKPKRIPRSLAVKANSSKEVTTAKQPNLKQIQPTPCTSSKGNTTKNFDSSKENPISRVVTNSKENQTLREALQKHTNQKRLPSVIKSKVFSRNKNPAKKMSDWGDEETTEASFF